MAEPIVLDLHDIATILTWERLSTEPRTQGQLREVSTEPDGRLTTVGMPEDILARSRAMGKKVESFVLQELPPRPMPLDFKKEYVERRATDAVKKMEEAELEAIYHRVSNYDGCYRAIEQYQTLISLYPKGTKLRVRTADGEDYTCPAHQNRIIEEYELIEPSVHTMIAVMPSGTAHMSGHEESMAHSVWGFMDPEGNGVTTILDLAYRQFNQPSKGGEVFFLGKKRNWEKAMAPTAAEIESLTPGMIGSFAINPSPDPAVSAWCTRVAKATKARLDAGTPFCGLCGAPDPPKKCPCGEEHYCSASHQRQIWPFHRKYCSKAKKK